MDLQWQEKEIQRLRKDERRVREAPRRDDRKEESRNSRDEEKGKEGIKHRGATMNGRPSKFTLLKPKKAKRLKYP